ncbi:MAG TPA: tetratricopeptide repeat protein [Bryobacteraceae bacterium]|nr:tetratricopeptide repeat protein [Bryobacteraceae bacterium]
MLRQRDTRKLVTGLLIVLTALAVSCSRNPDVTKRKYLLTGDKYFALGKYRQASIMYRSAIRLDARFGEAYYRLASAELKQGRINEAVKPLRAAVELLPHGADGASAKSSLANIYLSFLEGSVKDPALRSESEALVADLLRSEASAYDGHRLKARLAMLDARDASRRGLPDEVKQRLLESIREFRQADAIKPFQLDIIAPLGRSLMSDRQFAEAEKVYRAQIGHDKTSVPMYGELYNLYVRQRRLDDAESVLKEGLANNPKELLFLTNLATHYHNLGRKDEAVATVEKLKSAGKGTKELQRTVGALYVKLGNLDEAIRQYELGIRTEPNGKSYYQKRIAEVLISARRNEEAGRIIESILKDDPKDGEARLIYASNFLEQRDVNRAITELRSALQANLSNPLARYLLGSALMDQGQNELALPELQKAMQLDTGYLPARLKFAQLQVLLDQNEGAIKTTQNIFEDFNPDILPAKLIRAVALRNLGRFEEARAEIHAVLKRAPGSSDAMLQLAEIHLSEKSYQEAEKAFRMSYQHNPADLRGLLRIVDMYIARGDSGKALRMLDVESKKYPGRLDLRRALADMSVRTHSYDSAITGYKAILTQIDPKSKMAGEVLAGLGEAYRSSGQYDLALQSLERARQQLPEDAAVLSNLALTMLHLGRNADAKELYEKTFNLQSENPVALNNLAYLIAERNGDLDTALTFAQRARQKWPAVQEISDTVAWIYLKKNLTENAIEILADLVSRRPTQPTFRYHLGAAWLQKGEKTKARKELEHALINRPSQEEAAKIKALLAKAAS